MLYVIFMNEKTYYRATLIANTRCGHIAIPAQRSSIVWRPITIFNIPIISKAPNTIRHVHACTRHAGTDGKFREMRYDKFCPVHVSATRSRALLAHGIRPPLVTTARWNFIAHCTNVYWLHPVYILRAGCVQHAFHNYTQRIFPMTDNAFEKYQWRDYRREDTEIDTVNDIC